MTEWLERVRGELAGRYRIERELGRGSTATVYLAEDLAQQRQVAVKVLHPELVQALGGQRFLREIRLAASLHHPHLLAIHDSGEANGLFYFVAPYLPDGSLRTCLKRERQLSVDEAVRITREIADALGYVHEHGIVHRDVKPENILFAGKHACVADFGIARAIDTALGDTLTSTGLVVGTPAYMSPEQASGERAVDARSDQYSLGCVLYEMLAGVPPFVGATAQSVISQRFAHAPSPLTFYRPNVPAGIESALARALSIAPADRFASVNDFVEALDRRAPAVVRIDPAVRLRIVRRRWFAAGVAAAVVVIGLFGFQAYDRLDGSLFTSADVSRAAESGRRSAQTSRARRAYLRGHRAWARGEFESAYEEFGRAISAEPLFAHAHLWFAQVGAFARIADTTQWRSAARRAFSLSRSLGKREAVLSSALFALAEERYPDACTAFEEARVLDSLDFAVWYGLGECRFLDSVVVASPESRSSWAFRSSFDAAISAYRRSIDLDERAFDMPVYERLRGMLKASPRSLRWGVSADAGRRRFVAYPEIDADAGTLAFTPFEAPTAVPDEAQPNPANHRAAIERNGAALLAFIDRWIAQRPRSSEALNAYAQVLDARGDVADHADRMSALTAARSARTLTTDPIARLDLGSTEVRILLKRAEFARARALADSMLSAWPRPIPAAAHFLGGLAALTGRVRLTARMRAFANSDDVLPGVPLAPPLMESIALLDAYAALGVCGGLEGLRRDVLEKVDGYIPETRAAEAKATLTELPAMWSAECGDTRATALREPASNRTVRAQQAFARGERKLAKAILDSAASGRRGILPGEISIDYALQETWLRAAMGDTATAIRRLDLVLRNLSVQGPSLVTRFSEAAALPRAMTLRAELAAARGDPRSARYWASSALDLWRNADRELAPAVAKLHRLTSQ
jgi:tRNA A-37 threonylcarbamoyl transferase component Bud32/tetratricopeptide (TPR) repeat protein